MSYSQGVRVPDIFEKLGNWSYTGTGTTPALFGSTVTKFIYSTTGSPGLLPERIISRDVGYLYTSPSDAVSLDLRVFDDTLTNLVSGPLSVEQFLPTNNGADEQRGAEGSATYRFNEVWSGYLTYSHVLVTNVTNPMELTLYSPNSGSLGVSASLPKNMHASLAYYGAASGGPLSQAGFSRQDLRLSRDFVVGATRINVYGMVQYYYTPFVSYYRGAGDTMPIGYSDRVHLLVGTQVNF